MHVVQYQTWSWFGPIHVIIFQFYCLRNFEAFSARKLKGWPAAFMTRRRRAASVAVGLFFPGKLISTHWATIPPKIIPKSLILPLCVGQSSRDLFRIKQISLQNQNIWGRGVEQRRLPQFVFPRMSVKSPSLIPMFTISGRDVFEVLRKWLWCPDVPFNLRLLCLTC